MSPSSLNSDITKTFKCLTNGPQSRDSISVIHPTTSHLPLISHLFTGHALQKSINRLLLSLEKGHRSKRSEIALPTSLLFNHRLSLIHRTTA
ncbi:hypothetical protein KFK09_014684 [Dendrobium nobile]|uniref:Uncharacterized protein n=1 Tax=Dendrobium nobile TaxID=94219 RepID=A0A8T3B540_DENNO|nr:hypothetical protein KFK09_014684 [Dendrobium nobile]